MMEEGKISTQDEVNPGSTPTRSWRTHMPVASKPALAAGVCIAQIGPVSNSQTWYIEYARVKCNSTPQTTLELFKNTIDDLHSIDSTATGNDNIETPPTPGIYLGEGEILIFQWTGASIGAVGVVNAQVRVFSG